MKRGTITDFFETARKRNTRSDACEAETKETSSNETSECLNESVFLKIYLQNRGF